MTLKRHFQKFIYEHLKQRTKTDEERTQLRVALRVLDTASTIALGAQLNRFLTGDENQHKKAKETGI